jgi:hypothetical protein
MYQSRSFYQRCGSDVDCEWHNLSERGGYVDVRPCVHACPLVDTIFWIFRIAQYARSQDRTRYAGDVGAAQSGDTASICPVPAILGAIGQVDVAVIYRLMRCSQAK